MDEKGTLLDVITDDQVGRFSQLSTALILTGLDQMLRDEDEAYTFFAPSDKAFSRLPQDYLQRLVNEPGHHGLKGQSQGACYVVICNSQSLKLGSIQFWVGSHLMPETH